MGTKAIAVTCRHVRIDGLLHEFNQGCQIANDKKMGLRQNRTQATNFDREEERLAHF